MRGERGIECRHTPTLVASGVLTASQFLRKTNDLLDFIRVFWDNRACPTETHDEFRVDNQQR